MDKGVNCIYIINRKGIVILHRGNEQTKINITIRLVFFNPKNANKLLLVLILLLCAKTMLTKKNNIIKTMLNNMS